MASVSDCTVTSEIYSEYKYVSDQIKPRVNKENVVSLFSFVYPPEKAAIDADGDMIVQRNSETQDERRQGCLEIGIKIEHSCKTELNLVGLQVWRGAFLLADWLLYNGDVLEKDKKKILELGSGTGLTSIVAAFYTNVICTDINKGGILKLIEENIERNKQLMKNTVKVCELDFTAMDFHDDISKELAEINIILAADVIYDDYITESFIETVNRLLRMRPTKSLYMALEKRYVFTVEDCDTVAPCYEHFLRCLKKLESNIKAQQIPIDFPQYFKYDRVKELVLWKFVSKF